MKPLWQCCMQPLQDLSGFHGTFEDSSIQRFYIYICITSIAHLLQKHSHLRQIPLADRFWPCACLQADVRTMSAAGAAGPYLLLLQGLEGRLPAHWRPIPLLLTGTGCQSPEGPQLVRLVGAVVSAVAVGGVHAGAHVNHMVGPKGAAPAPAPGGCTAAVGGGGFGAGVVPCPLKGAGGQLPHFETPYYHR